MDIHQQAQLVKPWLSYLPLRGDRTESKSVLQHLLKLVAEKPGFLFGARMANAGLLIKAMIKYLQLPKVASEEEIRKLRATLQMVCAGQYCGDWEQCVCAHTHCVVRLCVCVWWVQLKRKLQPQEAAVLAMIGDNEIIEIYRKIQV